MTTNADDVIADFTAVQIAHVCLIDLEAGMRDGNFDLRDCLTSENRAALNVVLRIAALKVQADARVLVDTVGASGVAH